MITEKELKAVVGRQFPGGEYTIEPYVDWLMHDVVLSARDGKVAHPIFGFVATLRGKGMSLDELFATCGATSADGPMFGEHEIQFCDSLRVGETYAVDGEFISAERKHGKKAGTFDIVAFRLSLTDTEGCVAATAYNSFVFPRRAA